MPPTVKDSFKPWAESAKSIVAASGTYSARRQQMLTQSLTYQAVAKASEDQALDLDNNGLSFQNLASSHFF